MTQKFLNSVLQVSPPFQTIKCKMLKWNRYYLITQAGTSSIPRSPQASLLPKMTSPFEMDQTSANTVGNFHDDDYGSVEPWSIAMQKRIKRKKQRGDGQNKVGESRRPHINLISPNGFPTSIDSAIKSLQIPNIHIIEATSDQDSFIARSAGCIYPRFVPQKETKDSFRSSSVSGIVQTKKSDLLIDSHGRFQRYLRISLTDRCNFKCQYCMPDGDVNFSPAASLMTPEEIRTLVEIVTELGVNKVRLTGGEPTFRPEFSTIVSTAIPEQSNVDVYAMTTNGALIDRYFDVIQQSRMNQITLSLDSLLSTTFESICQRKAFNFVWKDMKQQESSFSWLRWNFLPPFFQAMLDLIERDFCLVKLNCVVMRDINNQEIFNFIKLTEQLPIHVRFIEFMPFDRNRWRRDVVVPKHEILECVKKHFGASLQTLTRHSKSDVADVFRIDGYKGCFGIISPVSDIFCKQCDRIRVNSDGTVKNCLFSPNESESLRPFLQSRSRDKIFEIISATVKKKELKLGGAESAQSLFDRAHLNRPMTRIGG